MSIDIQSTKKLMYVNKTEVLTLDIDNSPSLRSAEQSFRYLLHIEFFMCCRVKLMIVQSTEDATVKIKRKNKRDRRKADMSAGGRMGHGDPHALQSVYMRHILFTTYK